MRWTVVIPVKALPDAKSRLLPASVDAAAHRRLVEAIRADTVAAARATDGVDHVLIVTDRPGDDDALVQTTPGLNPALEQAARQAARSWPDHGIAALVGDLPALRPGELAAALAAAATHPRGHVPDATGTGTTLLTCRPGVSLQPQFGAGSAARHAAGSAVLAAGPGLRSDVDTADDLRAAAQLGFGPATEAVLRAADVTTRST